MYNLNIPEDEYVYIHAHPSIYHHHHLHPSSPSIITSIITIHHHHPSSPLSSSSFIHSFIRVFRLNIAHGLGDKWRVLLLRADWVDTQLIAVKLKFTEVSIISLVLIIIHHHHHHPPPSSSTTIIHHHPPLSSSSSSSPTTTSSSSSGHCHGGKGVPEQGEGAQA